MENKFAGWLLTTLNMLRMVSRCPNVASKVKVLQDMIFPNCEKLGQTIIFVRTKDTSRALHAQMQNMGYKITSIQVWASVSDYLLVGCRRLLTAGVTLG